MRARSARRSRKALKCGRCSSDSSARHDRSLARASSAAAGSALRRPRAVGDENRQVRHPVPNEEEVTERGHYLGLQELLQGTVVDSLEPRIEPQRHHAGQHEASTRKPFALAGDFPLGTGASAPASRGVALHRVKG